MSDRPVATDALATLGTIISENEKRDAIHLAVIPAIAGQNLSIGADVGLASNGKAYHVWSTGLTPIERIEHVGIVDPFLKNEVGIGERFWLVIYPRKITSLRHVWVHPAFPDESAKEAAMHPYQPDVVAIARKKIEDAADDAGLEYDELLERIEAALKDRSGYISAAYGHDPDERLDEQFWVSWSIVTGRPIPFLDTRPAYFSCSC